MLLHRDREKREQLTKPYSAMQKKKIKGGRKFGDSRRGNEGSGAGEALKYTFLKRLAAQGVARRVAEFVGEVTVSTITEANSYPTVVLPFVKMFECRWRNSNGEGDIKLFKVNSTLRTLTLEPNYHRTNKERRALGQSIGESLKVNSTLQTLVLCYNGLGETGGQAIGEALKVNTTANVIYAHTVLLS